MLILELEWQTLTQDKEQWREGVHRLVRTQTEVLQITYTQLNFGVEAKK